MHELQVIWRSSETGMTEGTTALQDVPQVCEFLTQMVFHDLLDVIFRSVCLVKMIVNFNVLFSRIFPLLRKPLQNGVERYCALKTGQC